VSPDDTDEIPADLAEAVRHAAGVVPPARHSLSEVHRRRRLHQRRRTAAVAGVATVAVAAGAAGVPALVRSTEPPAPGPAASATAGPTAAPAQRLLISGGYVATGSPGVTGPKGVLEVDAAGRVVAHPVTGMDTADMAVALPDGRIVMLGPRDLLPGVRREDGPDVTGLETVLSVGTYSANVRIPGQQVDLVGATADGAYLLRGRQRLVFHEFGTGTERPLDGATATMGADDGRPGFTGHVLVRDRFLVFHTVEPERQRIDVVDVTSGARMADPITIEPLATLDVGYLALSPDGRTLALVVTRAADYRLLSLDVATGRVTKTQTLALKPAAAKSQGVLGLAFTDNRTVRVAWLSVSPPDDRVHDIAELLRVSTLTV
jgi:hypothetical protein